MSSEPTPEPLNQHVPIESSEPVEEISSSAPSSSESPPAQSPSVPEYQPEPQPESPTPESFAPSAQSSEPELEYEPETGLNPPEEGEVNEKTSDASNDSDDNALNETALNEPVSDEASSDSPVEQLEQPASEDDYDPESVSYGIPSEPQYEPSSPVKEISNDDEEKVPIFNDVIAFYLNSPLVSDSQFQAKTPSEKETQLLYEYNRAKGTNVRLSLNFGATKSFNKDYLKKNDTNFPEVPMNPFCLRPDLTVSMSYDELQNYTKFVSNESTFLKSGKWDNFPIGSRIFIGNLAVNTVSKQDVFRIFQAYGNVMQINIKQGYGFVQFDSADACNYAIKGETNVPLHGKIMHLEVSKAQVQKAMEQSHPNESRGEFHENRNEYRNDHQNFQNDFRNDRNDFRNERNDYRNDFRNDFNNRDRPDYRSRSPPRSNLITLPDGRVPDVQVFTTMDSNPFFNKRIMKTLVSQHVIYKMYDSATSASNVSEESINNVAYNGVMAAMVTNAQDVNLKTFEKTPDGGIRFDEYANISVEEAANILAAQKRTKPPIPQNSFRPRGNFGPRGRGRGRGFPNRDRGNFGNFDRGYNNFNPNYNNNMNQGYSPQFQNQMSPQFQNQMNPPFQNQMQPQMQHQMPHQLPQQMPQQMQNPMHNQMQNQMAGMDPSQLQNMFSMMQGMNQQQQQQQPPPPASAPASSGNPYTSEYAQAPPPSTAPPQSNPSNALFETLSRLQKNT